MERGGDVSSGCNVVDKTKSLSNSDFVTSTDLQISSFPPSSPHHHGNNLGRPFLGDDDDGPTNNSGGATEVGANSYRGAPLPYGAGNYNFQSFNIFRSSYSTIYTPQGGMLGFPFTGTQLKELERQAMIYKFMISSVPVPLHLLPTLSTNFPAPLDSPLSSLYSGRYSKNGDPEPGRCKRTDGKKWRCSKEVAPQQKYCERHLHRGRPRSRKPVEAAAVKENHKKTRLLDHNKSLPAPTVVQSPPPFLNAKTDLTISTPPYYNREGKIVASDQPWESYMKANCYIPEQQQPLDVFSYPNIPPSGSFIDAWSIENLSSRNVKPSISVNDGDLSPSLNLSMAMAAGNIVDREMRNIEMAEDHHSLSSFPWEPFLGPLGEVLQASNPASPSGVLHWTLFSQSDSSVCNSPTFVAPPSEGSNQWHN